jgi:hypothetical protein
MDPKRRFFFCVFLLIVFCVLQHWNWMFSLGAFAAITLHGATALYAGDMYMRTLSLETPDVIYRRGEGAFSVALVIHAAILLLFLFTLLLRVIGL